MYKLPKELPFSIDEFKERVRKVKASMQEKGIDVLLITDPANLFYLTGYDAESFYVDQVLLVSLDGDDMPVYFGRYMDALSGITKLSWIDENHVYGYPDDHVQNPEKHAMDWISKKLIELGYGNKTIGVGIKTDYITPYAWERYKVGLPDANLVDGSFIVNRVRSIKSEKEIEYMMRAGQISANMINTFFDKTAAGVRMCDIAAAMQYAQLSGTKEFGGAHAASAMMFPRGELGGAPHVHWDQPLPEKLTMYCEAAGCYNRYHAPFARTVCIGEPPEKVAEMAKIIIEGLEAALGATKAGVTCDEVAKTFSKVLAKYGHEKESRLGYATGIGYMPTWGERTISVRPGDYTVLQPNMCLHYIPSMSFKEYGVSMSQSFCVTETGIQKFYDLPYDIVVK